MSGATITEPITWVTDDTVPDAEELVLVEIEGEGVWPGSCDGHHWVNADGFPIERELVIAWARMPYGTVDHTDFQALQAQSQPSKPNEECDVEQLAHRMAWRYKHSSDPHHSHIYSFNRSTLLHFAAALRAGTTAQPSWKCPTCGNGPKYDHRGCRPFGWWNTERHIFTRDHPLMEACPAYESGELIPLYKAMQPDRHTLQARGEHPAPCARHCEARAFEIENGRLQRTLKDLIAAALMLADEFDSDLERPTPQAAEVREMCARALVQPDVREVEQLVREFEGSVWDRAFYRNSNIDALRTALLDAVRAIVAERDHAVLCADAYKAEADHFRGVTKMVPDGRKLVPVECEIFEKVVAPTVSDALLDAAKMVPAASDPDPLHLSRILHELAGAASMCWTPRPSTAVFASQQAIAFVEQAIAEIRQRMRMMSTAPQPVSEVPMPDDATTAGYTLHALRTYGEQCCAAGYAAGVAAVRDYAVQRWKAEVDMRPLENKHRRTLDDVWRQVIAHTGGDPVALIGPCHDALVALRGEVKP